MPPTDPPSTRDRLVAAGVALLDEEGQSGLGLRAITRRAGVSHGAPRRYFPTHAALLAAVAGAGLRDLTAALVPLLADPEQPPGERLRRAATAYVDFARERPAMFELMFRHDLLEGAGEHLRGLSVPLFERLVALCGEDGRTDPERSALRVWTGVHGVAGLLAHRALEPLGAVVDVAGLVSDACAAGSGWPDTGSRADRIVPGTTAP